MNILRTESPVSIALSQIYRKSNLLLCCTTFPYQITTQPNILCILTYVYMVLCPNCGYEWELRWLHFVCVCVCELVVKILWFAIELLAKSFLLSATSFAQPQLLTVKVSFEQRKSFLCWNAENNIRPVNNIRRRNVLQTKENHQMGWGGLPCHWRL